MELNTLGIVLSYHRKKEGLPLEAVCDGLCSAATLERIERGERIADSLLGKLLLERLGQDVTQFELILNDEDYMLWRMREDIRNAAKLKDYDLLCTKIADYREMQKNYDGLHEQFCLYHEVMMEMETEKDNREICELAMRALRITKPNFCIGVKEAKTLYTQLEVELTLNLIRYGHEDYINEAENELLKLLSYVEYFYTERKKEEVGMAIIMELVKCEQNRLDYGKAIEYLDKGISFLSQGRGIKELEKLHFLKAQIMMHTYDSSYSRTVKKQEIQKECLMSYCICEVMGMEEEMQEIERFCEEKLAWQIIGLEM